MTEYVHWVKAGDPEAARKHRLTLLAECGEKYVPFRTGALSSLPSCPKCEDINGTIPRDKRRWTADELPHFVYRCFAADGLLLYVGCTVDPKMRGAQHQQGSWWFAQVASTRLTVYPSKLHARRVERDAIQHERPIWNVRHQNFDAWGSAQIARCLDLAVQHDAPDPVLRRFTKLSNSA